MRGAFAGFRPLAARVNRVDEDDIGHAEASTLSGYHVGYLYCNDTAKGPAYVADIF